MHGTCKELTKPLLYINSRWIFHSLGCVQPMYTVTYPGLQRQDQLFFFRSDFMAVALVCLYFTGDEFCFQGVCDTSAALGEVLHVCPGLLDGVGRVAGSLTQSFEHPWGVSADTTGLLQLRWESVFLPAAYAHIWVGSSCSWLLRCLFLHEDPGRANTHAQKQGNVHMWSGIRGCVCPQEPLCSVATCQLKPSLQVALWLKAPCE